jgi:hypothetical protein
LPNPSKASEPTTARLIPNTLEIKAALVHSAASRLLLR